MRDKEFFKITFLLPVTILASSLIFLLIGARPVQDDYATAAGLSQFGLLGYLNEIWQNHGGNIASVLLNSLACLPFTYKNNFFGIATYGACSISLILFTQLQILRRFGFPTPWKILPVISIFLISSFEGVFTPGLIGATTFTSASATHVIPVCLFILFILHSYTKSVALISCLGAGLFIGNFNITETFLFQVAILVLIASSSKSKIANRFKVQSIFFFLGLCLGMAAIGSAPGFWKRANGQVGLPESIPDFLNRFSKAASSFSFDILTHPIVFIAILLGLVLKNTTVDLQGQKFAKILLGLSGLYFSILVFSSSIAYTAWHQDLGLYVLVCPALFGMGYTEAWGFFSFNSARTNVIVITTFLLACVVLARPSYQNFQRGQAWDQNFKSNFCLTYGQKDGAFAGANLTYPIFHLGIEDLDQWKWMQDSFATWITNPKFDFDADCNS
jgi:hypothetical protein